VIPGDIILLATDGLFDNLDLSKPSADCDVH
jgi:serine/threonine protein phosphatase PrpC